MSEEKQIEGLGGWLILVGLGIIISPFRIVAQVFPAYSEIFSNGSWAVLTTPGTEAYNPLWAPILFGEMIINGGMVITWIFIAFLFFSKKKIFPKWYIGMLIFSLAFIVFDALIIKSVLPNEPVFDAETIKEFGRSLIATLIWVPYMLVSKRVKATFVK
jgi:branched-subunit amino acid transport protein